MTLVTLDNQDILRFSPDDLRLIKESYCRGATDADFRLFIAVCEKTRLSPIAKQIYAVMRWDSNLKRNAMTVQTSIDGLRLVAERTGKYAPGRATTYEYDSDGKLRAATAFVKKQTMDGTWHEVAYTAFFEEYCQKTKEGMTTKFWRDLSHVMIAKVAEAACLRRCFPMELSGLYTSDEMEQAKTIEVEPEEVPPAMSQEDILLKMDILFSNFEEADQPKLTEYLDKWMTAHGKNTQQMLERFSNAEELKTNFYKWIKK